MSQRVRADDADEGLSLRRVLLWPLAAPAGLTSMAAAWMQIGGGYTFPFKMGRI